MVRAVAWQWQRQTFLLHKTPIYFNSQYTVGGLSKYSEPIQNPNVLMLGINMIGTIAAPIALVSQPF